MIPLPRNCITLGLGAMQQHTVRLDTPGNGWQCSHITLQSPAAQLAALLYVLSERHLHSSATCTASSMLIFPRQLVSS